MEIGQCHGGAGAEERVAHLPVDEDRAEVPCLALGCGPRMRRDQATSAGLGRNAAMATWLWWMQVSPAKPWLMAASHTARYPSGSTVSQKRIKAP